MNKKKILIIIAIILILLCITVGAVLYNNSKMSVKDIIELSNNLSSINNVKLHIENVGQEINPDGGTFYIKDGIEVSESGEIWTDTKNGEKIYVSNSMKYIQVIKGEQISELEFIYALLKGNSMKYKYIGEEDINGHSCYVFTLTQTQETTDSEDKTSYVIEYTDKYYIDKETGLVIQEEKKQSDKEDILKRIYHYTFDVVTDEDVKKVNLEDYPDYEIENIEI